MKERNQRVLGYVQSTVGSENLVELKMVPIDRAIEYYRSHRPVSEVHQIQGWVSSATHVARVVVTDGVGGLYGEEWVLDLSNEYIHRIPDIGLFPIQVFKGFKPVTDYKEWIEGF